MLRGKIKWWRLGLLALAGALVLSQGCGLAPLGAREVLSQEGNVVSSMTNASMANDVPARTITVVGQGSVKVEPDMARATVGVETMGANVKEASAQTAGKMDAVIAALKQAGVAEKDMQTSGYNIWTDRAPGPDGRLGEEPVYRVSNNVNIIIRDLGQVGPVLDAALAAGANAIHGVRFDVADPEPARSEAREKAVANAAAKAEELADLNGVERGAVISVSEVIGSPGPYGISYTRAESAVGMGGGAGPIAPGELEIAVSLQIVYAIQ